MQYVAVEIDDRMLNIWTLLY